MGTPCRSTRRSVRQKNSFGRANCEQVFRSVRRRRPYNVANYCVFTIVWPGLAGVSLAPKGVAFIARAVFDDIRIGGVHGVVPKNRTDGADRRGRDVLPAMGWDE